MAAGMVRCRTRRRHRRGCPERGVAPRRLRSVSVIVSDTGPLVAAALSKDPDHHRCVDLFTGLHLANRQMVPPAPVVAEVSYLIGLKAGAAAEASILLSLADGDLRHFTVVRPRHVKALTLPSE